MPYETQGPTPLIPALAGLAATYFQIKNENQRLKQEQQDAAARQRYEAVQAGALESQYNLDAQGHPVPMHLESPFTTPNQPPIPAGVSPAMEQKLLSDSKLGRTGAQPQSPLGNAKPGTPEYMDAVATFYYQKAAASQNPAEQAAYLGMAKQAESQASTESYFPGRAAEAPLRGAETGYYGARTRLTNAEVKNVAGKFQHDLDMIHARGVSAESVARIRAAYRRSGGGTGSAAAEQRAEMAALNAAAREGVNAQNAVQEAVYRYQADLNASDPDNNPAPQAPQLMPYPVYMPGPNGQPTVIMVNPNGQVEHPPAAEPRNAPKPPASAPAARGPSQQGSPGRPWWDVGGWYEATHGSGGGQPAKMTLNGKTYYRHADGKYYTSPP